MKAVRKALEQLVVLVGPHLLSLHLLVMSASQIWCSSLSGSIQSTMYVT
jgi:hypothetical protein